MFVIKSLDVLNQLLKHIYQTLPLFIDIFVLCLIGNSFLDIGYLIHRILSRFNFVCRFCFCLPILVCNIFALVQKYAFNTILFQDLLQTQTSAFKTNGLMRLKWRKHESRDHCLQVDSQQVATSQLTSCKSVTSCQRTLYKLIVKACHPQA